MNRKYVLALSWLLFLLLVGVTEASAGDSSASPDSLLLIKTRDGSVIRGTIREQDDSTITIMTLSNFEVKLPRSAIVFMEAEAGVMTPQGFRRYDRNNTRLLFAPTGRPLRKGAGYFTDCYIFFPGLAWGITDNLGVLVGFSIIPGLGFSEQLLYIAPKIGVRASRQFAFSMGTLYATVQDEFSAGMLYAVGTAGPEEFSLTMGTGLGYTKEKNGDFRFGEHPVIMIGGYVRLSNSLGLVSESWVITGGDAGTDEQPFSLAFRFNGDHLSADVGAILVGKVIDKGFPAPWLSMTHNFGR